MAQTLMVFESGVIVISDSNSGLFLVKASE
jgi:hypothetical protein